MKHATLQPRQSLWDVAVEHCGSADAAFAIAEANGHVPTARNELSPGHTLVVPEPVNSKVAAHFANHRIVPATQTNLK